MVSVIELRMKTSFSLREFCLRFRDQQQPHQKHKSYSNYDFKIGTAIHQDTKPTNQNDMFA